MSKNQSCRYLRVFGVFELEKVLVSTEWQISGMVKWSKSQQVHNVVRSSPTPNLNALSHKLWSDKLICRSCRGTNLSKYSSDKWASGRGHTRAETLWCKLLIELKQLWRLIPTFSKLAFALLKFALVYCQICVKVWISKWEGSHPHPNSVMQTSYWAEATLTPSSIEQTCTFTICARILPNLGQSLAWSI